MSKKNSARENLRNARQAYQATLRQAQLDHDHKDNNGPTVESLSDTKINVQDKHKYPSCSVICTECMEIFDLELYPPEKVESIFFELKSMLNQIAVFAELGDDDQEELRDMREYVDSLQFGMGSFYNSMVRSLGKNGGKGKHRNKGGNRSVGRIGIGANQFN